MKPCDKILGKIYAEFEQKLLKCESGEEVNKALTGDDFVWLMNALPRHLLLKFGETLSDLARRFPPKHLTQEEGVNK